MRKKTKITVAVLILLAVLLFMPLVFFDEEKAALDEAARAVLPGSFVTLPAGVVHYELSGPEGAPAVVLVHGFSVPYYVWDPTAPALARAGFRVLRYDLYGRGYSDRPDAAYDLDFFVKQLFDLLDALSIEGPVAVVGLSMGGPVAASFAVRHPGRVRALCLIDPQAAAPGSVFPLDVPLAGEYLMSAFLAPLYLPQSQPKDFFRPGRFPDWERRYHDQMRYPGFRRALLRTIRSMARTDALPVYRAVLESGLPALLVWGREDATVREADIALVRAALPRARFLAVDEAGHLPHYERPEIVNPALIGFLKNPR